MTNLTDVSQWDAGVYQFATTDPIQGGPGGIDNEPHQNLTNRALWLRNRMAAAITQAGLSEGTSDNTQLLQAIVIHCTNIAALRALPIPVVPNGQPVLVMTRGQVTEGDGLAATYKWVYNSLGVDDGKITIEPNSLPTQGRWLLTGLNATALGGLAAGFFAGAAATTDALALKANLNSPNLTGQPTAPSGNAGDRTQLLATDQFVNDNFTSKAGISLVWNQNPNTYYKLATLPVTANNTADSVNIRATLNTGYAASNDTIFDGIVGNRAGFSYRYNLYGPNQTGTARIVCYQETDGSVSVYAASAVTFAYAYVTLSNTGAFQAIGATATLYPVPTPTTVPTGTLVFDSGLPGTYPPLMWVSAPGAYLTSVIAAETYVPLAGGTMTGNLVVAADLYSYRAGGTTGVVFLTQTGAAYVYWDGTKYNMPSGEVWANGFQLARLASPALTGTPTAPSPSLGDSSGSLATTFWVTTKGYDTVADVNAKIAGFDTVTDVNAKVAVVQAEISALPTFRTGVFACASGLPGTSISFSPPFTTLLGLVVCGGPLAGQFQTCSLLAQSASGFTATSSFNGGACSYIAIGHG